MARTSAAVAAARAPKSVNAAALKNRQNRREEHVEVLENNPDFLSEDAAVNPEDLKTDGMMKPPAVDLRTVDQESKRGPKVRRYRALNDKRVQTQRNGGRTAIVAGKELDELNYDIPLMRSQGLKLEDITDVEPPAEDELDEEN